MHLRAFSHDSNIWFSPQHDWQISAFGDKAGTDDKPYELQTSNDYRFEATKFSGSHFHWFVQLGLWYFCFTGVQLRHKVALCLPWVTQKSQKIEQNELQEITYFIILSASLSGSSVSVLFLTNAYPSCIYLFIYWQFQWRRFHSPFRQSVPVPA